MIAWTVSKILWTLVFLAHPDNFINQTIIYQDCKKVEFKTVVCKSHTTLHNNYIKYDKGNK